MKKRILILLLVPVMSTFSFAQTQSFLMEKANEYWLKKDYAGTIADCMMELANNPQNAQAFILRGRAQKALGNFNDAISDFDEAIKLDPRFLMAYLYRGEAKDKINHTYDAIAECDRAIAIDPNFSRAWFQKALWETKMLNYTGAIADLDHLIAIDPSYPEVYYRRGLAKRLGYHYGVVEDMGKEIEHNPFFVDAYFERANANLNLTQYAEAIVDYDKAITLNPKNANFYNNRGLAKFKLDRYADAISDFDEAISISPTYATAYNNRGNAYYWLGHTKANYRKAIENYDMSVKVGGSNYKPYYQYRDDAVAKMDKAEGL
jgi:tetratricopeptide (TPR) repeat protein